MKTSYTASPCVFHLPDVATSEKLSLSAQANAGFGLLKKHCAPGGSRTRKTVDRQRPGGRRGRLRRLPTVTSGSFAGLGLSLGGRCCGCFILSFSWCLQEFFPFFNNALPKGRRGTGYERQPDGIPADAGSQADHSFVEFSGESGDRQIVVDGKSFGCHVGQFVNLGQKYFLRS